MEKELSKLITEKDLKEKVLFRDKTFILLKSNNSDHTLHFELKPNPI